MSGPKIIKEKTMSLYKKAVCRVYIFSITASPMSDSNKLKRVGLRGEKENEKAEKDD